MPRQLPWANKGSGSRTQVKQPPRPATKQHVASDIDDDFFDGTILASSRKGKGRVEETDDGLPDLPAEPSTPRTKARTKNALHGKRALSSSPPPIADLEEPRVEPMRKAVSKFDLRDDEWMMVEDEFLETAKLFVRHLHIAEYEKMKERIEEKKKQAEVARPVVANAKMSADGMMREKAKILEKKQRKAIRDVFASQNDDQEDEVASYTSFSKATSTASKRLPKAYTARDIDSDDLDASKPPTRHPLPRPKSPISTPTPIHKVATGPQSASSAMPNATAAPPSFKKPAPPQPAPKPRSRINRATPFDMLDDYTPRKSQLIPKPATETTPNRLPPPLKTSSRPANDKTAHPDDSFDSWGSKNSTGLSKETSERLAKRKAEKEKEEKEKKRKTIRANDIPTFLF